MPEKQRIIVADDERVIADTLAIILNHDGFDARAVYSGEEALQVAATFAPHMLISDVIMGELNGVETAIMMRTLVPNVKVLLFSGHSNSAELLKKANALGFEFEILAKPVHPKDLLSRLRPEARPSHDINSSEDVVPALRLRALEREQHCN